MTKKRRFIMSEQTVKNIAEITREGIKAGKKNQEILEDIKAVHPEAKTTLACVNWYRYNDGKRRSGGKKGEIVAKFNEKLAAMTEDERKVFLVEFAETNLDKIVNALSVDVLKGYLPAPEKKAIETETVSEPSVEDQPPVAPTEDNGEAQTAVEPAEDTAKVKSIRRGNR